MGPGGFFPTNPELATFWAGQILILRIFIFGIFVGSQISRFPNRARARLGPGLGRAGPGWAGLGQLPERFFCSFSFERFFEPDLFLRQLEKDQETFVVCAEMFVSIRNNQRVSISNEII